MRRMWIIGEPSASISPYTCIMSISRPYSNSKCEPQVKIAYYNNILACIAFHVSVFYIFMLSSTTKTRICVPSIAPMASLKWGQNLGCLSLSCTSVKVISWGQYNHPPYGPHSLKPHEFFFANTTLKTFCSLTLGLSCPQHPQK
jgi:hypothetical protein